MNEIIVMPGGKREHATDTLAAQTEALEPLQEFFKEFGACIISGCEITLNTPGTPDTYDVAGGIVSVLHDDGHKLARFEGVTNVNLPGHITIVKAVETGVYESGIDDVFWNYTAQWNAGTPGVIDDKTLMFGVPATNIPTTFKRAAGFKSNTAVEVRSLLIFIGGLPAQEIKFWVNEFSRTLHMQATLVVRDYAGINEGTNLLFGTPLPLNMRPTARQWFTAYVDTNSAFPFIDTQNKDYVRTMTGFVEPNGIAALNLVKPVNGGNYNIRINAIMQLD